MFFVSRYSTTGQGNVRFTPLKNTSSWLLLRKWSRIIINYCI